MPGNVTREEGNDDQAFWGLATLSAAEYGIPDPPKEEGPSRLALAQAVFNNQASRWDTRHCGGGLHWQIFPINPGYDYKSTISNGAFFQSGARLARYTGNETYASWANKAWDWLASTPNLTPNYEVNDGSAIRYNCTDTNHLQWSYNYGTLIFGSAYLYTITLGEEQLKGLSRIEGLLKTFFSRFYPVGDRNIMVEITCEPARKCNADQTSFKAHTTRWLALTAQLVPHVRPSLMPKIMASAAGAAKQCTGGKNGTWCGQNWSLPQWDGFTGVGETMSALAAIGATLVPRSKRPFTARDGGTSVGDSNAGGKPPGFRYYDITKTDRAIALTITLLTGISMILGAIWISHGED